MSCENFGVISDNKSCRLIFINPKILVKSYVTRETSFYPMDKRDYNSIE